MAYYKFMGQLMDKELPNGHEPKYIRSCYLRFLEPPYLEWRLAQARYALKSWSDSFDAIAFRGMSGALLAPPLAMKLGKSLLMVRKTLEGNHGDVGYVEGDKHARAYVIVDDFRSSGATCREIIEQIERFAPQAKCIGLLEVDRITEEKLRQIRKPLTSVRGTDRAYRYPLTDPKRFDSMEVW